MTVIPQPQRELSKHPELIRIKNPSPYGRRYVDAVKATGEPLASWFRRNSHTDLTYSGFRYRLRRGLSLAEALKDERLPSVTLRYILNGEPVSSAAVARFKGCDTSTVYERKKRYLRDFPEAEEPLDVADFFPETCGHTGPSRGFLLRILELCTLLDQNPGWTTRQLREDLLPGRSEKASERVWTRMLRRIRDMGFEITYRMEGNDRYLKMPVTEIQTHIEGELYDEFDE